MRSWEGLGVSRLTTTNATRLATNPQIIGVFANSPSLTMKATTATLPAAMEASELPRCEVAQLARSIQISALGAAAAALLEHGDVAAEVVEALDAQLASYI